MKNFKWRIFFITSIVCLLPVALGVFLWSRLPDSMAIHFDVYGTADGVASKAFVVFGFPVLMVVVQGISCFVADFTSYKYEQQKRIETVTKWIIPFITVALYMTTLGYNVGLSLDMRKVAAIIVGIVLLVTGKCLPECGYVKNHKTDREKALKINRFTGCITFVMGILFLLSSLLPPVSTLVCVILLIPFGIISAVYAAIIERK